jgi:hypothetical protein
VRERKRLYLQINQAISALCLAGIGASSVKQKCVKRVSKQQLCINSKLLSELTQRYYKASSRVLPGQSKLKIRSFTYDFFRALAYCSRARLMGKPFMKPPQTDIFVILFGRTYIPVQ